ncbi:MAG: hypothetical protein EZS28_025361 [Streblomastix strix]|uniref:Uncharacterized protein n=1 Tax=Streblomastix strix TaxID=222440 RepID=A0A5J4V9J8_9EUKA|nr:MAG: hypothetical protein EZS28_025361 [Streblomastix strix]
METSQIKSSIEICAILHIQGQHFCWKCTNILAGLPYPINYICKISQTEEQCRCVEDDPRQLCECIPFGDKRTRCEEFTVQCEVATPEQFMILSSDICDCLEVGDPRTIECPPQTIDIPQSVNCTVTPRDVACIEQCDDNSGKTEEECPCVVSNMRDVCKDTDKSYSGSIRVMLSMVVSAVVLPVVALYWQIR